MILPTLPSDLLPLLFAYIQQTVELPFTKEHFDEYIFTCIVLIRLTATDRTCICNILKMHLKKMKLLQNALRALRPSLGQKNIIKFVEAYDALLPYQTGSGCIESRAMQLENACKAACPAEWIEATYQRGKRIQKRIQEIQTEVGNGIHKAILVPIKNDTVFIQVPNKFTMLAYMKNDNARTLFSIKKEYFSDFLNYLALQPSYSCLSLDLNRLIEVQRRASLGDRPRVVWRPPR